MNIGVVMNLGWGVFFLWKGACHNGDGCVWVWRGGVMGVMTEEVVICLEVAWLD